MGISTIIRAIFYTLLPRDTKKRLLILGALLLGFIFYSLFNTPKTHALVSDSYQPCSTYSGIDWVSRLQTDFPTFSLTTTTHWAFYHADGQDLIEIHTSSDPSVSYDDNYAYFTNDHMYLYNATTGDYVWDNTYVVNDSPGPSVGCTLGFANLAPNGNGNTSTVYIGTAPSTGGGVSGGFIPEDAPAEVASGFLQLVVANILAILGVLAFALGVYWVRRRFTNSKSVV